MTSTASTASTAVLAAVATATSSTSLAATTIAQSVATAVAAVTRLRRREVHAWPLEWVSKCKHYQLPNFRFLGAEA